MALSGFRISWEEVAFIISSLKLSQFLESNARRHIKNLQNGVLLVIIDELLMLKLIERSAFNF